MLRPPALPMSRLAMLLFFLLAQLREHRCAIPTCYELVPCVRQLQHDSLTDSLRLIRHRSLYIGCDAPAPTWLGQPCYCPPPTPAVAAALGS